MENKGNSQSQRSDTHGEVLATSAVKLPKAYHRLKRDIARGSQTCSLLSFLNERAAGSESAVDFCQHILRHSEFSSFKTIHLFRHEKGQSFALKHEVSLESDSLKELHVNEFNQLFQAIKKSKNRSYGQDSLKGFNFDILGTFMAREFALENHNIILIISRNDFLPQTFEEKAAFSRFSKVISPYFNLILERELEASHFKNTRLAFKNLPGEIKTSPKEKKGSVPLPSGGFYKFELYESLDKADIFHQERIALLGELLNTLKHELSNPLFGLQLSAELLKLDLVGEHAEFMEEISCSIKRSQSIISNFTDLYTTSESLGPADLERMVKEVFTLTKSQSRHIRKAYTVVEMENEQFEIKANSVWLAQILFNLIVNSAQALNQAACEDPFIEVKAYLRSPIEIHVIDNGPGFSAQTLENMFKPFFTTKEKGTGLGLAISQSLAAKLNGKIECAAKGQGAHFILELKS